MKFSVLFSILFLIFHHVYAQNWEVGVSGGGANYLGDLSPDIVLKETHGYGAFFFKKNISPFFSHNFYLFRATVSGDDNNFKHLKVRNLNFKSQITELSYQLEFNFFKFAVGLNPNRYTPYVFVGIGTFVFQPVTTYNGSIIRLHSLDTEGKKIESNKNSYHLVQPVVPFGGGFKIKLRKDANMTLFCGFRYTFTDYLDDVSNTYYSVDILEEKYGPMSPVLSDRSEIKIGFNGKQRGRPDMLDFYYFYGINLSFQIRNKVCFEF